MSDLLERLREETRPLHEQTEQLLYTESLRTGTLSVDEYAHLLLIHGAFHQALEREIDSQAIFFKSYTPDTRRKTPWLQADLAQLGQTIPSLPNLFAHWSPAELLGAAYVGEGSMLGGKTVWHYLQQSPALQPLLAQARFYRGYGADTGPNWRAFGAFVADQPTSHAAAIIDGANRAFMLYAHLFERTPRSTATP